MKPIYKICFTAALTAIILMGCNQHKENKTYCKTALI
jgi:uncharacterized lipoprotein NlpE involved in copper resistance